MTTALDQRRESERDEDRGRLPIGGAQEPACGNPYPACADPAENMLGWKYRHWIEALVAAGGHFLTAADILDGKISTTACNLLLRHDIDQCELYANVWPLLAIEYRFGVRSTIYLFAEHDSLNWARRRSGRFSLRAPWKLNHADQVLRYQEEGFEFGLHVDVVGRCRRRGNTVDSREALAILDRDLDRLRSQGIRVRTMAAHGFAWPDAMRSWYDNYAAEFDYTAANPAVRSQFHVLERFAELGRPVSAQLGLDRMKRMRSIWLPRHVPFGWLHAESRQVDLRADALTLTDAGGVWKHIGIKELAALLPRLPGCLIVLNVHPIYYAYGDNGLEFVPRAARFDDHRWLANDTRWGGDAVSVSHRPEEALGATGVDGPKSDRPALAPGDASVQPERGGSEVPRTSSRLSALRYRGRLDFDRIGPDWVSERLDGKELEKLNRQLRRVNARFKGGPWFDRLIQSPNAAIIAWLDEFVEPAIRGRLRVIELCGGVGPVAIGLTRHGFRPENMAVTDFDPKHLDMARALNDLATGGKMRVFAIDVRDIAVAESFDIAVISSWENSILPYDLVTAQCKKLVADGGLLVMTFLEKGRIDSEGYDYFPDRLLQRKTYHAIAAEALAELFQRNRFEPVCYLDHGYPKVRFPRHVMVGKKGGKGSGTLLGVDQYDVSLDGPAPAGMERDFRPLFLQLKQASQRYFDELRGVFSRENPWPSWAYMLNVGPLAGNKNIEDLPPTDRVRLLSLCVRKATCHPFGPWDLDYSKSGFDRAAVMAGLLVGYGNKCGAVAELTRSLLEAHGLLCRTIHCAGHMPSGELAQHCLNEVLLDGRWRLLDNDVFQFSDSFFTADDGSLMTREEVLSLGLEGLVRRFPWPYTYRGFDYDPAWVERNWSAWRAAVGGAVRDLG
jgi:hypothetical protein